MLLLLAIRIARADLQEVLARSIASPHAQAETHGARLTDLLPCRLQAAPVVAVLGPLLLYGGSTKWTHVIFSGGEGAPFYSPGHYPRDCALTPYAWWRYKAA